MKNCSIFCPLLGFEKWALPGKTWAESDFDRIFMPPISVFERKNGHLPTFCPLLKPLFGHEKPSVFKGLRAQSPLCPLFPLHYYDKKIKNIVIGEKKWVFGHKSFKEEEMPKITWDDLYTNFKSIYPNLGRQSLRFQPYGYMMILVYLTDGSRMIYDDLRKQAKMSA